MCVPASSQCYSNSIAVQHANLSKKKRILLLQESINKFMITTNTVHGL